MGEYAEYGFDQQRLIWYVCRLWDVVLMLRPNKKMCVSGYMPLEIRVGRSDYFLFFEIILFA